MKEYRELWNMLNVREKCLLDEIDEIRGLKSWIDLRTEEIKLANKNN